MLKGLLFWVVGLCLTLKNLHFTVKGLIFGVRDQNLMVKYVIFNLFEVSLGNTGRKWKAPVFPSISHESPPWKIGTTKLALVTPFFHKKDLKP